MKAGDMKINRALVLALGILVSGTLSSVGCRKKSVEPDMDRHVILIGIDGMGAQAFQAARTPNLKRLARQGALSLKARSVMPTVSSPSWGSILTGAGPEQHGMTSNSWLVDRFNIAPTDKDEDGFFPSIFTLIRRQMPGAETAVFYDWDALANLFNNKVVSRVEFSKTYPETFAKAIPFILEKRPQLAFLYVGRPDDVGHEFGYDSEEFYQSCAEVDAKVGELLDALGKTDWGGRCTVLAVVDHGGTGRGHGGESMIEVEVPWIISGPGIIKDKLIEQPVNIFDTAPTIALILGLEPPFSWIGRPVRGAFGANKALAAMNTRAFVPKPKSSLGSGLYAEPRDVSFTVDDAAAEIRYVVSGNEASPDLSSARYDQPIPLAESCVVTAVAMRDGAVSELSVVNFERIFGIKGVILGRAPDEGHAAQGPLSLVDGKWGNQDPRDRSWLGFSRDDLEAIIEFGSPREVQKAGIDIYEDEKAWIRFPVEVDFLLSEDGKTFLEAGRLTGKDILKAGTQKDAAAGPARLLTRAFKPMKARFLKVRAKNVGYCPAGSPGEGEKAWLFVDEIIVE